MSLLTDAIEKSMLKSQARMDAMLGGPVLSQEKLINLIKAQAKSADMWIQQWERYKDVSGVRNASLAIGKIFGLYSALLAMNGGDTNAPEEIIELMQKYQTIWDELHISREIADVISKHGN
jgi:hypothetical protein